MVFKKCNMCNTSWATRDDFLRDPSVELIGYQVNFENLKLGFFLFNHSCKTTLLMEAEQFVDLYNGPIFTERLIGSDGCPSYCLHTPNLDDCPAFCECAYIRKIIQIIKNYNS